MFFSLLKFSIFPPFFSISIPISKSKVPKISISISKSIFLKCKFQYQYQNQYFETVVFNIKININMIKILTFQHFSKFCPMSAADAQSALVRDRHKVNRSMGSSRRILHYIRTPTYPPPI